MRPKTRMQTYRCETLAAVFCLFCATPLLAADQIGSSLIEQETSRAITEPDASTTIVVSQPIALVFDALLSRLAEYSEDVASVEFDHSSAQTPGTLGVGSRRTTTMVGGDILVQRILLFEPPSLFAYFTDMSRSTVSVPIDYSIGYYSFVEQADGTVAATVSVAYRPSSRLTALLIRIGFNRALVRDFERAAAYLNSR